MELDCAEDLLDDLGLRMFAETWWLDLDGQQIQVLIQEIRRDRVFVAPSVAGPVAKSVDMNVAIEVPLLTERLHQEPPPAVHS